MIARWLAERQAEGRDPSDATLAVVQAQQQGREALTEQELIRTRHVDMTDPTNLDALVKAMQDKLPVN